MSWEVVLSGDVFRKATLRVMRRYNLGTFDTRVRLGATARPPYAHCVYYAAKLAKRLGYAKISVIEFGVAGGSGLLELEHYAALAEEELGLGIEIYGFDTGHGLPAPLDYRDLPYHWKSGYFRMNETTLRHKLRSAKLILGEVRDTVPNFISKYNPAPIGAVIHDLDLYSATVSAFGLFESPPEFRLPRIHCYFDDIIGGEVELYNDYTGERLAIQEFNVRQSMMKLCPSYNLICQRRVDSWHHQIFVCHDFAHPRYCDFVSEENQQLPLTDSHR